MKKDYQKINADTWDKWASAGSAWSQVITHEEYVRAQLGDYVVFLTPSVPVPADWLGNLKGKKLLGLASGGGQQIPVFSALGAICTVMDNSPEQLQREKMVKEREGYNCTILKGDMTKPFPFLDDTFDIIFHPVSNCYIEDVCHVWHECYRVLKKGGILLAGFDNGVNFLFADGDTEPLIVTEKLPYNPLKMSEVEYAKVLLAGDGIQFSHSLTEQLAGQLKEGFVIEDLYEDRDRPGVGIIREYMPQYMATKARKKEVA